MGAAAFVQNRKAYTGCTDAPNPSGVSGRPWCYVEPQLLGDVAAWNYCGAVVNYDALREESKRGIPHKIASLRTYVGKLQKAQRAAEKALDMFHKRCAALLLNDLVIFAVAPDPKRSRTMESLA